MTHSSARVTLIQSYICFCVITMTTRFYLFVAGYPFYSVMSEQDVWNANKRAIASYAPSNKDLKLIWERDPKTERIIKMFHRSASSGRGLHFIFLWRKSKDVLRIEHS